MKYYRLYSIEVTTNIIDKISNRSNIPIIDAQSYKNLDIHVYLTILYSMLNLEGAWNLK